MALVSPHLSIIILNVLSSLIKRLNRLKMPWIDKKLKPNYMLPTLALKTRTVFVQNKWMENDILWKW